MITLDYSYDHEQIAYELTDIVHILNEFTECRLEMTSDDKSRYYKLEYKNDYSNWETAFVIRVDKPINKED